MAPLACKALDDNEVPLVGLRVILECFNGEALTYEAYTTFDGTIDAWSPVPDLSNPDISGPSVRLDSREFISYRLTFYTAEHALEAVCPWPSVQIDMHLRGEEHYFVTMVHRPTGYQVQVDAEFGDDSALGALSTINQDKATPAQKTLPGRPPLQSLQDEDLADVQMLFETCGTPVPPTTTQPRKRGRPRKTAGVPKVARKRGRPRKYPIQVTSEDL